MPFAKLLRFRESNVAPVARSTSSTRCWRAEEVASRKYMETRWSWPSFTVKSNPSGVVEYQQAAMRVVAAPGNSSALGLVDVADQVHCEAVVATLANDGKEAGAPTIQ